MFVELCSAPDIHGADVRYQKITGTAGGKNTLFKINEFDLNEYYRSASDINKTDNWESPATPVCVLVSLGYVCSNMLSLKPSSSESSVCLILILGFFLPASRADLEIFLSNTLCCLLKCCMFCQFRTKQISTEMPTGLTGVPHAWLIITW